MASWSLEGGMMTKQFLVRADLAFGLLGGVPISTPLPVKLGPFQLDHSPNADLGQIEPHQFSRGNYDSECPMSLL